MRPINSSLARFVIEPSAAIKSSSLKVEIIDRNDGCRIFTFPTAMNELKIARDAFSRGAMKRDISTSRELTRGRLHVVSLWRADSSHECARLPDGKSVIRQFSITNDCNECAIIRSRSRPSEKSTSSTTFGNGSRDDDVGT